MSTYTKAAAVVAEESAKIPRNSTRVIISKKRPVCKVKDEGPETVRKSCWMGSGGCLKKPKERSARSAACGGVEGGGQPASGWHIFFAPRSHAAEQL